MKKIICILLTILLTACLDVSKNKQKNKVINIKPISMYTNSFFDYNYNENYENIDSDFKYPLIKLKDEDNYNNLNKTINNIIDKYKEEVTTKYVDIRKEASLNIKEEGKYSIYITPRIRRSDSLLVSLLFDYTLKSKSENIHKKIGVIIDSQNGKILKLKHLFKDRNKIIKSIKNKESSFNTNNMSYTIEQETITFYDNDNIVCLSLDSLKDNRISKYNASLNNYGMEIDVKENYFIDINNDKTLDKIYIDYDEDKVEGFITNEKVSLNNKTLNIAQRCFSYDPTLIKYNNTYYLYLTNSNVNDYNSTSIYNLTTFKHVDEIPYSQHKLYFEGDIIEANKDVIVNPEKMVLETQTELLSTNKGYKTFSINKDGLPKSNETYYTINEKERYYLTAKEDIVIDNNVVLKKGEGGYYSKTNNENIGIIVNDKNNEIVIKCKRNDFITYVNDKEITDLFDGITFTG